MDGMSSSNHKLSAGLNPCENSRFSHSSKAMAPGNYRYPEVKTPLRRQVHAPSRNLKIGLAASARQIHRRNLSTRQVSGNPLGNFLTRNYNIFKRNALDLPMCYRTVNKEVIDVEDEPREVIDVEDEPREVIDVEDEPRDVETISDDTSMEVEMFENAAMEVEEKAEEENEESFEVVNLENGSLMLDNDFQANKKSSVVLNPPVTDVWSFEAYRKALKSAEHRTSKLKDRGFGDIFKKRLCGLVHTLFPRWKQTEEPIEDVQREPFRPLSKEDETAVKRAFSANNQNILVTHEKSNIDITGENLRCLKPGQWLNDEVINLYLVLLKEREAREPKKFLKCHFFNTFFFTKLVHSRTGYNYGAVRRWTSVKRLGYCLIDCDKIFVPIHMSIHWTLAVINIRDQKFQYLDSFKGREPKILDALARYFVDEVRDKSEVDIDVSRWKQEYVLDLPMQRNGFDCGMFMLKYIDFYSRGLDLCFTEEQMPYFRVRTAKEILQLKAE